MDINVESWLMRRALQAAPQEACGFVLRDNSIIEMPNVALDPHKSFEMSRVHFNVRVANPDEIEAVWHTHPGGSIYPSGRDQEFLTICQWRYLIVTSRRVVEYDTKIFQTQPDWATFNA